MNQSDFENFVNMQLQSCIVPFKRLATDKAGDGITGNTPPFSPEEFQKTLTDYKDYAALNDWSLDRGKADAIIAIATHIYVPYFAGWVNTPLYADAPQVMKDWQAAARKAAAGV
jgi:hypothetical protein